MQLTLLQTRLAASITASLVVVILYLLLVAPSGALAANFPDGPSVDVDYELEPQPEDGYEPNFMAFDKSIIGRVPLDPLPLSNNKVQTSNLDPGATACYSLAKNAVFGDNDNRARGTYSEHIEGLLESQNENAQDISRRQDAKTKKIYISVNTCLQPHRVKGGDGSNIEPPQLRLIVANSTELGCPALSKEDSPGYFTKELNGGAVMHSMNFTDDIYVGISAPNGTDDFKKGYFFEVAISTDDYFHRYESKERERELLWLDSDYSSALLVSKNLTTNADEKDVFLKEEPPYEIYVDNEKFPRLHGLHHSRCGIETNAQISADPEGGGHLSEVVRIKMTTRGPGGYPKQQFYITSLNSSTDYSGILVKPGNASADGKSKDGVVGGGGTVFGATGFQTLSGTTCTMVTELKFCNEIQYAVPGNIEDFKDGELGQTYDDFARKMYGSFEKALMQIQCDAPSTQRYSLTKTCQNCKDAYKKWLCTVAMPRCEDYMSNNTRTIVRNVGQSFPNGTSLSKDAKETFGMKPASNSSRNSFIDEKIKPGPYKEILPCDDLCYEVVQSCPAQLQFACPLPGMHGFDGSYGQRDPDFAGVACNYPGEFRTKISSGAINAPSVYILGAAALFAAAELLG